LHDCGELVRAHAAGGEVRFRGKGVHQCHESIRSKRLSSGHAPYEVEVHRIGEESLLRYQHNVVQAAHIVDLDLRLHAVLFHRLAEILQHGKGILEHEVDEDLAGLPVDDAEVHRVRVERGHLRLDRHDLGYPLFRRLAHADGRAQVHDQLGALLLDGVVGLANTVMLVRRETVVHARVHVHHGRPGLIALVRLFRELCGRVRHARVLVLHCGCASQRCRENSWF